MILNRINFKSKIALTGLTLHQRKDLGLFSVEENDFRSLLTISLDAKWSKTISTAMQSCKSLSYNC